MKYVSIEKHQAEFSIKAMCRMLRVARSGWYTWCQRRIRSKRKANAVCNTSSLQTKLELLLN